MLKINKLLVCVLLLISIMCSSVFATGSATITAVPDVSNSNITPVDESPVPVASTASNIKNEDLLITDSESNCVIDYILHGNAFINSKTLNINSKQGGGAIFGDVFASTTNTSIESDIVYSENKDKIGNYIIDTVNSTAVINGNVYVIALDTFTLGAKSQIYGDLYVFADIVNIEEDALVQGNVFIVGNSNINLNGKVTGSVYAMTNSYSMNYTRLCC